MTRRGAPQPRSLGDERIIAALRRPGCPLCTHADRRGRDHLHGVLYELVTDVPFRARLVDGGGFCRRHTRLALAVDRAEIGGTTAAAILFRSVLKARREALRSATGRRSCDRLARATRESWRCPVCEEEVRAVDDAAGRLVEHASADPAWRDRLLRSTWCLHHVGSLAEASARAGAELATAFIGAQVERLVALDARLEGLVDHSSHDRLGELTADEQDSADLAAAILAGTALP